ncbi:hypothetical protein TRFO_22042 [Tritrichomonas foetus]|uniref:Uncharacterized protein n=1 Tax=Tritrichomonas foetus TaxID=1144522 RepID=A0A1J4KDY4_9EUKA|nr:hypothetical protein TRFO_22042 [Tritrichomonas foetus]|eukprot:OHT09202.1 hypothetical protein TRFO_22042 [Tritrichomonas foetus]
MCHIILLQNNLMYYELQNIPNKVNAEIIEIQYPEYGYIVIMLAKLNIYDSFDNIYEAISKIMIDQQKMTQMLMRVYHFQKRRLNLLQIRWNQLLQQLRKVKQKKNIEIKASNEVEDCVQIGQDESCMKCNINSINEQIKKYESVKKILFYSLYENIKPDLNMIVHGMKINSHLHHPKQHKLLFHLHFMLLCMLQLRSSSTIHEENGKTFVMPNKL